MQLYDKDLLSMQEVRELVEAAKEAQKELANMSQSQVDHIVRAIADAGVRNARRLAEMAHEDTGFGKVEDKIIKNIFGSRGVYEYIKDMKTVGELDRDDVKKVRTIAVPVGVIAGLVPSTNPTSTALYKAEIAIKAGNAIVFSPHPTALRCISETVKVIRQAISEAGGNENLVSCITIPTMEATDNLMRHRDVAMILATGGSAMVRAAYSSGTPAIGVGPGNGPAYLEKTCDLPLAVKRIMDSKTFDNGTICASEQSIICDEDMVPAVRAEMEKQGASVHLLTSLYDIAWLLNVRGGDIDYVPVVLSYLALTEEQCLWFVQDAVLTDELRAYLAENRIETRPYESFYDYAAAIPAGETVLLDKGVCNYRLVSELCEGVEIVDETNPSVLMKSIKNETEQKNTVNAHIKDGVAVTKFIYWLKKNIGKTPMTELSASDYLAARRAEQEGFLDLSFDTICAYGAHAAIIHYAPTPETDIPLEAHGLLLVDSGGHYLEGTTDITRTIALGPVTDAERADFTRVLRSHLHLANARFLHGCTGLNLDILAREPLWEADLDYKHGTGHGVGHILNVHEGPNGFRWRQSSERSEGSVLEEGMITTDEPGLYIEDAYGIRIESELLCRKGVKNEFGQFMYFQNLTCAPIDLDAIDVNALTVTERRWLNEYHAAVYETVAPHLTEDERVWLRDVTRAI